MRDGVAMGSIYTVIMAGGSGTRFWPLSRKLRPKQFLPLGGDGVTPLLTATAQRVWQAIQAAQA